MILIVSWAIENNIVYFEIYFGCFKIVIVFWAVENNLVYLKTKYSLNSIIFVTTSVLPYPLGPEIKILEG